MLGFALWGASGFLARMDYGVVDRGDPLLNAWILAWDQRQIARDPLRLFDANIFHPFPRTLAYSETILGPALLAAPARLFTSSPVAVQNVSMATSFVALALAGYALFLWIGGDRIAAAVGGLLVAFAPVRLPQLGHVQLLHSAGLPLMLLGLWWFLESKRKSAGALFAGALLFSIASSFHLGFMAALCVPVALAAAAVSGDRGALAGAPRLLPWAGAAAAVALPILAPYWKLRNELGFSRPLWGNWGNWASHKSYLRPVPGSFVERLVGYTPRASLYLGLTALALAAVGVWSLRDRRNPRARVAAGFFAAMGALAFLLSLGGWRDLGKYQILLPFYFLHRLPGVDGIRAPVRLSILVDLCVVGLAVLGLVKLRRSVALRAAPAAAVVAIGLGLLAFVERAPRLPIGPGERIETASETPHVYRLLASDPVERRVLELPMLVGPGEREPWDVVPYKYVYFSTVHWNRIVNGTSGYVPPRFEVLEARMDRFPSPETIRDLPHLPIDRVVVHRSLYKRPIPTALFLGSRDFRVLHDCSEDLVLEVSSIPRPSPLRLAPKVTRVTAPGSSNVLVSWSPGLPPLLYPPERYRLIARFTSDSGGQRTEELRLWLVEPRWQTSYRVTAPEDTRRVAVEIRTATGESSGAAWEIAPSEKRSR